jgi:hypothetical protein
MNKIIANMKRPNPHPGNQPAEYIYSRFQAVDDPQKMIELARQIRAMDRKDGREAYGNGPHSAGIREAIQICREDLASSAISRATKQVILSDCVPALFPLISGSFTGELKSLSAEVDRQMFTGDVLLVLAAQTALKHTRQSRMAHIQDRRDGMGARGRAEVSGNQPSNA